MLLARKYVRPVWPACWLDTPNGSSSSGTRVVEDVWDVNRDALGVVPGEVVLALRNAVSRSSVDDFWTIWSKSAEAGLFRAYSGAGGPTEAGSAAFLGRGLLRIRSGRLGGRAVGGAGVLVSCIGLARVMRWMYTVPSILSTLPLLLLYSFVGALNLWRMHSKVSGEGVLHSLSGMLFWVIGMLYVVMVRVVLFLHFIPGTSGFLRIYMVSVSGFLIPLGC